jgi:protein SCO1/2
MALSGGRLVAVAAGTVAIFLGLPYLLSGRSPLGAGDDLFAECRTTRIAGGSGAIGGSFSLVDEDGRRVTDQDVLSEPALVYFGYTYCPDVCPTDTARNAEAIDILEERGFSVTPVFISVDPRRDTPDVLKEWTDYLHPRMIGLTGSEEEIRAVAQAYKTYYKVPENPADDTYLVDHMTQTYLMLPGVGFVEFFSRDETAETLADRVACFLDTAGPN